MKYIEKNKVIGAVREMVLDSAVNLEKTVCDYLKAAFRTETEPLAKNVLDQIIENQDLARKEQIPLCQDTGIAVCFAEVGNQLHFDYDLEAAINEGVRQGYKEGYLRKSIVGHPLIRINTLDNTPAIFHLKLIAGDELRLHFAPKGGGSENMSRLAMLTPGDGKEGVKRFVRETIVLGGGKPCPPLIVGVGIGGNFEKCALLAKEAIFRPLGDEAENPEDLALERELFQEINALGVGPMGLGGKTTCLAVKVNSFACHIASLPVAVNLQCHSARKAHAVLRGEDR
mgnify:CR=1 FL=1